MSLDTQIKHETDLKQSNSYHTRSQHIKNYSKSTDLDRLTMSEDVKVNPLYKIGIFARKIKKIGKLD